MDFYQLAIAIKTWGAELGFQAVGISDTDLSPVEPMLLAWLSAGAHGDMDYMAIHGTKRARPAELVPGTLRVISVRLNYLPPTARDSWEVLRDADKAFISRYALGRDYHRVLRKKLQNLADKIQSEIGPFAFRAFADSAPVMEVALAEKAGLGWRGKHTLLLSQDVGSWFFLGELYTDLPLPTDQPILEHCGTCQKCLDVCPTQAITAPYKLDARRCISYLTIEHKGSIPEDLRPLIGNRVYGCDDCQLVCPWNKFAQVTNSPDFHVRNGLDDVELVPLFTLGEAEFEALFAGSPIKRIGYLRWLRNLAIGLGNAPPSAEAITALRHRANHPSALVREHVAWALARQLGTKNSATQGESLVSPGATNQGT